MKKLGTIAASLIIIAALMLTSGCLPKWTIAVSRYAQSNFLYDADDIGQVVAMAADDYTFLIFDVSLTNNGLTGSDIREELIFAVYDESDPLVKYENYYNQSAYDIFGEIGYVVNGKDTNEGAIFVPVPYDMDLSEAVFKIMLPNYDVISTVDVPDLTIVSDYPDSW